MTLKHSAVAIALFVFSVCALGIPQASGMPFAPAPQASSPSSLTIPADGSTVSPQNTQFAWTAVPGASSYTLWVGTAPGAQDALYFATNHTVNPAVTSTRASLQPGHTYYATLWTNVDGAWSSSASTFQTSLLSYLTTPADGSLVSPQNTQFAWTSVPGALSYTLWIGTAPGGQDTLYFATDHTANPTASSTTAMLQPGQTYYATLWTNVGGTWLSTASKFQTSLLSYLTAPANGSTVSPQNTQFAWTPVPGASSYTLWVGTTPGTKDALYYSTSHSANPAGTTSTTANLRPATTYYATLWTFSPGGTTKTTCVFNTRSQSYLTWPQDGATGVNPFHAFMWMPVPGAELYTLLVSPTDFGTWDNFNSQFSASTTTAYVWALQPNTKYYATLYVQTATGYQWSFTTFTTGSIPAPSSPNAFYRQIESLTGNVRLMASKDGNVPAQGSYLFQSMVDHNGSNPAGGANCGDFAAALAALFAQNGILSRVRITTLNGVALHVLPEYWDPFNQKWQIADATFGVIYFDPNTEAGQGVEDLNALLLAGNISSIKPLWVTNNLDYYRKIYLMDNLTLFNNPFPYGTPQNWTQIYNSIPNSPLSFLTPFDLASQNSPTIICTFWFAHPTDQVTINNAGSLLTISPQNSAGWTGFYTLISGWTIVSPVPDGLQIYTPRWVLSPADTPLATGPGAYLISPANGATVSPQNVPFHWTAVPGAISYTLWIGTAPGAQNALYFATNHTANPNATSATASLQPGHTYYSTLWTNFNGKWNSSASTFQTTSTAYLISPRQSSAVSPQVDFVWQAVPGATAYTLWVGTTPGGNDAVYYPTTGTSANALLLPGTTYYATLWTNVNNSWTNSTVTFQTQQIAVITSPTNGASNLDAGAPVVINWTSIPGVALYQLDVGTSFAGKDVYSTRGTSATSASVLLQPNKTYYARMWTDTSGVWTHTDSVFSTGYALAHLTYPLDGTNGVDLFQLFTWTQPPSANGYSLIVSPTGYGVKDFFVPYRHYIPTVTSGYVWGLQPDTLYYVRLCTGNPGPFMGGCVDSQFTTGPGPSLPDRKMFYQKVQSITAQVRLMTQLTNGITDYPTPGSYLYQFIADHASDPSEWATCGEFSGALLDEFAMNGITGRQRNISLDGLDGHVISEYWDPFNGKWQIADATFGIVYFDPDTQIGQSAEDVGALVVAQDFSKANVLWVTPYTSKFMNAYQEDPLIMFNGVVPFGEFDSPTLLNYMPNSPLPFLTDVTSNPPSSSHAYLVFHFANASDQVTVENYDGSLITITPGNSLGWAASVPLTNWSYASPIPAGMQVFTMNRYRF